MLFTLLTFLFPTIGAYYLLFALVRSSQRPRSFLKKTVQIRLAIILTQAVIDILLAFLNSFPLGALMLRLKDSDRLPGGLKCYLIIPFP
jgi:phosphatidylinositol N-acetylglucosaminyltransferase subunit Q